MSRRKKGKKTKKISPSLLAKKLTAIRTELGMSYEAFGDFLGDVHASQVWRWENQNKLPEPEHLTKIREKTGIDLRQNAVAQIPYRDDRGHYADFHALRHTYITRLVASNANIALVQSLARHSTPVLTINRYTDRRMLDRRQALAALPALPENTMAVRPDTGVAVHGQYPAGRNMPKNQSEAELRKEGKTTRRTPKTA